MGILDRLGVPNPFSGIREAIGGNTQGVGGPFPDAPPPPKPDLEAFVNSLFPEVAGTIPVPRSEGREAQPETQTAGIAPAASPSSSQPSLEEYTRQAAIKRGIDPEIAVRVGRSEGGFADPTQQSLSGRGGRREPSYGPFQLLIGGPGTGFPEGVGNRALAAGIDPRKPENVYRGIDFALDVASKEGWGQWYGAAKAGIGNWTGIRKGAKPTPTREGPGRLSAEGGAPVDTSQPATVTQPVLTANTQTYYPPEPAPEPDRNRPDGWASQIPGDSYDPTPEEMNSFDPPDPQRRAQIIANAVKAGNRKVLKNLPRQEIIAILQEMGRGTAGVPRISKGKEKRNA